MIRLLAAESESWWDDTWLVDSTPVECGRNRETAKRSDLAGFAGYGYCASHSRYLWGCDSTWSHTPSGPPVTFALAHPKTDEREVLRDLLESNPGLLKDRCGQTILADKRYRSRELETFLTDHHAPLIRPAVTGEANRPGTRFLKPLRQIIEPINDTLKGQLDLERHGGPTITGVTTRVPQRIPALTAAIWHNQKTSTHPARSLLAYDH